jgi:hypothetical protein
MHVYISTAETLKDIFIQSANRICFEYKNTNHQQMHKESFIINRNTLLHVSTLLGHLQGEYAVDCALCCFWRRELSAVQACRAGPERVHASSTQYTINSTFSLNYKVQP